jgi:type IV secretion system protein VirB9
MRWLIPLLLLATPARAEVTPRAGDGDPHIQSVAYDPQQVVALHVAMGFALTLAFAADERIQTVTLGDSEAWGVQANHAADRLVIRPVSPGTPTNLTVFTDLRAYNFTLYSALAGEGVQPYLVSFTYPPDAPGPGAPAPAHGYRLRGDRALWPAAISDDGVATRLRWGADQPLPAVYRKDAQGATALVNSRMRDGALVVEGVHQDLLFVLDGHRASARRIEPVEGGR